jgi:hypothetical protein
MEVQHLPTGILCDQLASTAATSLKLKITLCGAISRGFPLKKGALKNTAQIPLVSKNVAI